jgi:hypothetical protein
MKNVAPEGEKPEMMPYYAVSRSEGSYEDLNMGNSVYSTPIVAGNVLYIANKSHLFAIANEEEE